MPANHEPEKAAVAAALRELEQALGLFVTALGHQAGPVSAEQSVSSKDALRRVCEAYATIDYEQEDEVNRSSECLGVVGGNATVIARAKA